MKLKWIKYKDEELWTASIAGTLALGIENLGGCYKVTAHIFSCSCGKRKQCLNCLGYYRSLRSAKANAKEQLYLWYMHSENAPDKV